MPEQPATTAHEVTQATLFELAPLATPRERSARRSMRRALREIQTELALVVWPGATPASAPAGNVPPLAELELPAKRGDCRGPGICPVFRCSHNIALRVKSSGAIKVDGGGPGTTLRPGKHLGRVALSRRMDRMVDAILERVEALGTSCTLDLVERHGEMGMAQICSALGVTEEIVRLDTLEGLHAVEIAAKRAARAEQRAHTNPATSPAPQLVQIRRKP